MLGSTHETAASKTLAVFNLKGPFVNWHPFINGRMDHLKHYVNGKKLGSILLSSEVK